VDPAKMANVLRGGGDTGGTDRPTHVLVLFMQWSSESPGIPPPGNALVYLGRSSRSLFLFNPCSEAPVRNAVTVPDQ